MSSGRKLVLAAISGQRMKPPRAFIETLRATCRNTDLVIFVRKIEEQTRRYLESSGATLVPFRMWKRWNGPIHTWRFVLFARYAAAHAAQYDWIMTSDLRDVIFQSDPFADLQDRRVQFYLENEAHLIRTDRYYTRWMKLFIDPALHAEYERHRLACCGVVIGGSSEMKAYLEALARHIDHIGLFKRRQIGADSAFHNLIAHVTHEVPGVVVENNQRVATMGLEPPGTYHIDDAGRVATAQGSAPPILHQYDRLRELMERSRYAPLL